jgi:hypothetical protein
MTEAQIQTIKALYEDYKKHLSEDLRDKIVIIKI